MDSELKNSEYILPNNSGISDSSDDISIQSQGKKQKIWLKICTIGIILLIVAILLIFFILGIPFGSFAIFTLVDYDLSLNNKTCIKGELISIDYEDLKNKTTPFKDSDFGNYSIFNVQMKGTHNSYHLTPIFPWHSYFIQTQEPIPDQIEKKVRNFEIDIHFSTKTKRWSVYHVFSDVRSNCGCIIDCLKPVKDFMENNQHHLLIVNIEMKYDKDYYKFCKPENSYIIRTLEQELLSIFDTEEIVFPHQVQGNYSTLRNAINHRGWPNHEKTDNKVLFALYFWEENPECRTLYNQQEFKMFFVVDRSADVNDFSSIVETHDVNEMQGLLDQNFLLRCYKDPYFNSCLQNGVHILSSDTPNVRMIEGSICNTKTTENCTYIEEYLRTHR